MKWWIVPGLVLVGLGLSPQARADDAAKAVIEKAIQASGGKEHIDKIKGGYSKSKGKLHILGGVDIVQEVHFAYPDKFRETAELEVMGQKIVTDTIINGGRISVKANGMDAPVPETIKDSIKEAGHVLQVMRLVGLSSKDFTLATIGDGMVEGKPAIGIKVSKKDRRDIDIWFDKQSHLVVKVERKTASPVDGQEINEERIITEYKKGDKGPEVKRVIVKHDGKLFVEMEVLEAKTLETPDENQFNIQ